MIGAIAGDIIGSYHEFMSTKEVDFLLFHEYSRFTDDTVLTVAVADWILNGGDLVQKFHAAVDAYPQVGYGPSFARWAAYKYRTPYNSWGNGSAMRVSPVGFAFDSLDDVLAKAKESAEVTHNHEEGIRGAQATAAAIFLARSGHDKADIKKYVVERFGYDLNRTIGDIRPVASMAATIVRTGLITGPTAMATRPMATAIAIPTATAMAIPTATAMAIPMPMGPRA